MPDRIADPWGSRTPFGPPAGAERIAARLPAPVRARLPDRLSRRPWPVRVDAAVRVTKVASGGGSPSPAPTVGAPAPLDPSTVPATVGGAQAEATAIAEA